MDKTSMNGSELSAMGVASWLVTNAMMAGLVRRNIITADDANEMLERATKGCDLLIANSRAASVPELIPIFTGAAELIANFQTHPLFSKE